MPPLEQEKISPQSILNAKVIVASVSVISEYLIFEVIAQSTFIPNISAI